MIQEVLLAFAPIFFAVDPLGLLPIFAVLTAHLNPAQKKKIIWQSLATALCLAVSFIFFGKWIFGLLGISMGDFMVAGGAILFCLSMIDLINTGKKDNDPCLDPGAVPIGTPLIAGPAVLTISLMLVAVHGVVVTLIAVLMNLIFLSVIFLLSDHLMAALGKAGTRALSKVMALLLAAIGVMMMRKGILEIITSVKV